MKHISEKLSGLKEFARKEIYMGILPFWRSIAVDTNQGGFHGEISFDHSIVPDAPKGLILNARLLWTFSAAYQYTKEPIDKELAKRAFDYICKYFYDEQYGGYYWTVNADGSPQEQKKQIYALAFVMYGMSEYFKISHDEDALLRAVKLFHLIEKHSFDTENNGYYEAFARDWSEIGDLRLSAREMNEKKTMNTHLHIVEAYANLYTVWKDDLLANQLENLVNIFLDKILSPEDNHLNLFFDEFWNVKSSSISYGHDIEATWLIHESALIHGNQKLVENIEDRLPVLVNVSLEGLSELGGLFYENDRINEHLEKEFEWWPQAETLVGLLNVYQVTQDEKYLDQALKTTKFIEKYIVDKEKGEWFFRVDENGKPIAKHEKMGLWKCPYHNGRACLEIIKRIDLLNNKP